MLITTQRSTNMNPVAHPNSPRALPTAFIAVLSGFPGCAWAIPASAQPSAVSKCSIVPAWGAAATSTAGLAAQGGASGIVIDNISSTGGAPQVYYWTLTGPGNAVQASQALLQ